MIEEVSYHTLLFPLTHCIVCILCGFPPRAESEHMEDTEHMLGVILEKWIIS
jgi:hypothetical protein